MEVWEGWDGWVLEMFYVRGESSIERVINAQMLAGRNICLEYVF